MIIEYCFSLRIISNSLLPHVTNAMICSRNIDNIHGEVENSDSHQRRCIKHLMRMMTTPSIDGPAEISEALRFDDSDEIVKTVQGHQWLIRKPKVRPISSQQRLNRGECWRRPTRAWHLPACRSTRSAQRVCCSASAAKERREPGSRTRRYATPTSSSRAAARRGAACSRFATSPSVRRWAPTTAPSWAGCFVVFAPAAPRTFTGTPRLLRSPDAPHFRCCCCCCTPSMCFPGSARELRGTPWLETYLRGDRAARALFSAAARPPPAAAGAARCAVCTSRPPIRNRDVIDADDTRP